MEKVKNDFFLSQWGYLEFIFYFEMSIELSSTFRMSFVQIALIWLPGQEKRVNFRKKKLKYLLLRKHKVDKANISVHVYDIIFYINCIFVQIRTGCCGNFCIFVLCKTWPIFRWAFVGPMVLWFHDAAHITQNFHPSIK